jgi:hypothetical protein
MDDSLLDRWKRFDDGRPSLPAEHWLTFGAALWFLTRETESTVGRVLSIATGLALVYRAASGRDGLAAWWARTRWGRSSTKRRPSARYLDTFVPYSKRVRVAAISEPIGKAVVMR